MSNDIAAKTLSMSRRGFVALAGGALATAGLALAGCSSDGARNASSDSSSGNQSLSGGRDSAPDSSAPSASSSAAASSAAPAVGQGKSLIAVFSWSGNTLAMAERIQQLDPDADFFRIEPADAYPENYDETAERARDEQTRGFLPELANAVENWDEYQTVFLGYPIWWYELPQVVKSFISQYDWTGKTIVPFNSHLGSGDGGTPADIAGMCPGASIADNLAIRGDQVASSLDRVDTWYQGLVG